MLNRIWRWLGVFAVFVCCVGSGYAAREDFEAGAFGHAMLHVGAALLLVWVSAWFARSRL